MSHDPLPRVKVGLIGCGGVARSHVRAYRDLVELVACCDVRAEPAEEFQREFGFARTYTRMEDLLADPEVELVDVCTQVSLDPDATENSRLAAVRLGAPAGKHFLIEKPLAREIASAREIVDLCNRHDVRLGIGHRFRYTPTMARARELLASGRYGEPFHAGYWLSHLGWHPPKPYARRRQMAIVEIGIHAFDLFRYLLDDEPTSVYCLTGRGGLRTAEDGPGDTHFDAIVRFRRGCVANILLSIDNFVGRHSWQVNWFGEVHLECPRGAIEVAGPAEQSRLRHCGADGRVQEIACDGEPTGFRGLMAEMLRALREGREPTMSGCDHLNTLATVFAAYESADSGQPVAPRLFEPAVRTR